ncbi:MAG: hypothetical protein WAT67_15370 [Candidatus Contendobacter sp.]
MTRIIALCSLLVIAPAGAQTMYKCPHSVAGMPPVYQQMPCSSTGGGEVVPARQLPGSGDGLRETEKSTLESLTAGRKELEKERAEVNKALAREAQRQEALEVERRKAEAMEAQAAAQAATARALWRRR